MITPEKARKIANACNRPDLYERLLDPERDLNAMHAAEKVLEVSGAGNVCALRDLYADHLVELIRPRRLDSYDPDEDGAPTLSWRGLYAMIHATAAQRADAFLLSV